MSVTSHQLDSAKKCQTTGYRKKVIERVNWNTRFFFISNAFFLLTLRVAKNRAAGERLSHEIKTRRSKCDTGGKKICWRKNICSDTNLQNVLNNKEYYMGKN